MVCGQRHTSGAQLTSCRLVALPCSRAHRTQSHQSVSVPLESAPCCRFHWHLAADRQRSPAVARQPRLQVHCAAVQTGSRSARSNGGGSAGGNSSTSGVSKTVKVRQAGRSPAPAGGKPLEQHAAPQKGKGRKYSLVTGFPFPLGPFFERTTVRSEVRFADSPSPSLVASPAVSARYVAPNMLHVGQASCALDTTCCTVLRLLTASRRHPAAGREGADLDVRAAAEPGRLQCAHQRAHDGRQAAHRRAARLLTHCAHQARQLQL